MTTAALTRALVYMLDAVAHAAHACERTRRLLAIGIAKLRGLVTVLNAAAE
jgi:hypothetical protein